jgi:branched-chain amino acid aminotransferase/4-amino-4-deoxychorismate lyase
MSAAIPTDDRGLLLGDGLFETILFKAGRPVLWDAHLRRLAGACAVMGLAEPDRERLAEAAAMALAASGLDRARAAVRLSWTAGAGGRGLERPPKPEPRLIAAAAASSRPESAAVLALSAIRRNESSPASRLKTLSYLDNVLARRDARAAGADEALMLNSRGELAGCAAANLFWLADSRLFTPALECGVLDGIMRAQVMAVAPALGLETVEIRAGVRALDGADAVFITNSLIGLRQAMRLDGRDLRSDGRVGALAAALDAVI